MALVKWRSSCHIQLPRHAKLRVPRNRCSSSSGGGGGGGGGGGVLPCDRLLARRRRQRRLLCSNAGERSLGCAHATPAQRAVVGTAELAAGQQLVVRVVRDRDLRTTPQPSPLWEGLLEPLAYSFLEEWQRKYPGARPVMTASLVALSPLRLICAIISSRRVGTAAAVGGEVGESTAESLARSVSHECAAPSDGVARFRPRARVCGRWCVAGAGRGWPAPSQLTVSLAVARAQRRHCEAELPSQEAYWLLGYLPGEKDPGQGWSEAGAATGGSDCSDLGSVCAITGLLVFRQPRPPRGPERSAAAAAAAWPTSTTRVVAGISIELSAVPLCSSCSSRTPFWQAIEPGALLHRHRQVRRARCQRPPAERRGGRGRGASGCCSCCHRVGDAARASAPGPGPGQLHTAARVSARSPSLRPCFRRGSLLV
jgi:hypothetical protein